MGCTVNDNIDRAFLGGVLIAAAIVVMWGAWMAGPLAIGTVGGLMLLLGMSLDDAD